MEPNDHTFPAARPATSSTRNAGRAHALDDHARHVPKWRAVEAALRYRLESGEFDSEFPTDRHVMADYEVCRETARRAIGALVAEGLLRRRRGLGTAVDAAALTRTTGVIETLEQLFAEASHYQHELLHIRRAISRDVSIALDLPEDQHFVELGRRYLLDGRPVAVERCWLLPSIGHAPFEQTVTQDSIYTQLRAKGVPVPSSGGEEIRATITSHEERQLLALDATSAVLTITRKGRIGSEPVEWRQFVAHPELIHGRGSWRAGKPTTLGLVIALDPTAMKPATEPLITIHDANYRVI